MISYVPQIGEAEARRYQRMKLKKVLWKDGNFEPPAFWKAGIFENSGVFCFFLPTSLYPPQSFLLVLGRQ